MKPNPRIALALVLLAVSGIARASNVPNDAVMELREASQELSEAALLRNVANDGTEAQHLLAARDLLREAEPSLDGSLRRQAQRLEFEIGRDAGTASDEALPDAWAVQPLATPAPLDRNDLGALARSSRALAEQAGR